ncbi:hypothetical protein O1611_g14 [Lasiodiplodia mahajangana]|uniref:Uncharacterized protein n=1 Tax=Lasiodiplodia mahajangana TaxID=1108764 RepID=A0ACC2K1U9_9PEZI|nr:hypothetical protein O1611_g14 [Lasiodiplodia mahajangana]
MSPVGVVTVKHPGSPATAGTVGGSLVVGGASEDEIAGGMIVIVLVEGNLAYDWNPRKGVSGRGIYTPKTSGMPISNSPGTAVWVAAVADTFDAKTVARGGDVVNRSNHAIIDNYVGVEDGHVDFCDEDVEETIVDGMNVEDDRGIDKDDDDDVDISTRDEAEILFRLSKICGFMFFA